MFKSTIFTAAVALAASTTAHAQTGGAYVSVGADAVTLDPDILGADDQNAIFGLVRAGYDVGRFFGFEGEFGVGSFEDERVFVAETSGVDGVLFDARFSDKIEGGNYFAVALRGRVPLGERAEIFARLGAGKINFESSFRNTRVDNGQVISQGGPFNSGDDTFLIGAGGQYLFGPERVNGVRFDITQHGGVGSEDTNGPDLTTVSLAYVRKF